MQVLIDSTFASQPKTRIHPNRSAAKRRKHCRSSMYGVSSLIIVDHLVYFNYASRADRKGPGVALAADGHRDIVGARSERSARDKDRGAEIVERIANALFRHRIGIDVAI